ncbi:pyruvate synthase [Candidatus Bathyarchaeota archaeon]|nr:MAG: pyruvate synthase [Candidatus Bathyarchaeota archaeon]
MVKRDFVEIRIHGRGGQGAWTASIILAEAALKEGKYSQSFPEFGPERSGAPVTAYARIGDSKIDIHAGITNPDFIIVIDPTLVSVATVGLKSGAKIIATSTLSPEELRKKLNVGSDIEVWSVDALKIAMETIGRPIANTSMLGAFVKATDGKVVSLEALIKATESILSPRLPKEVVQKNIEAIKRAYEEVKKG